MRAPSGRVRRKTLAGPMDLDPLRKAVTSCRILSIPCKWQVPKLNGDAVLEAIKWRHFSQMAVIADIAI